jgi:hypothetical protein
MAVNRDSGEEIGVYLCGQNVVKHWKILQVLFTMARLGIVVLLAVGHGKTKFLHRV